MTAGYSGGDAPAGTFDPFRTSIRDAVTRRVLSVTRIGDASRSRWSTTEAKTEGIERCGREQQSPMRERAPLRRGRVPMRCSGMASCGDSDCAQRTSGRKTWIVQRRIGGTIVKRTLASADAMSVEDARRAARVLIAEAECGDGAAMSVPMMQMFGPAFLADCAERWKPTTRAAHAHNMQRFILPAFGNRSVDAITARDVRNWFDELSITRAATANRSLAVLSSLMRHAEDRSERSNPCRGLRRCKSGFKAHYLTDVEFAALGWALARVESEYPVAVAAVRFLLYTGARKSEALGLRWEHVHGDRAALPDSKSGPRTIWLATPARAILAALPRPEGWPWVFASDDGKAVSIEKPWQAIRKKAGLGSLRIHDLRHSHAAVAVGTGEGLRIVAGLLGHADIETTFGYAHLAEGAVFAAANRVSRTLADALDRKAPANG